MGPAGDTQLIYANSASIRTIHRPPPAHGCNKDKSATPQRLELTLAIQAGKYWHNSITVGQPQQTQVQFLGRTLSSSAGPCLSSFLHPAATLQEIRWPPNFSLPFIACCTDWMADKNKGTQNPLMMRGSAIFLLLLWPGITTKTAAVPRMSTKMFCRNKIMKHKTLWKCGN